MVRFVTPRGTIRTPHTLAALAAAFAIAGHAHAEDRVMPGDASVEPPTLISLGVDWAIEGDDNRNASVALEYRRSGETTWHRALPLLRLQHEQVNGRVGGPSFVDAANAAESAAKLARSNAAVATANAASTTGPFAFSPFSYVAPNMFSGSVFDLAPDTDYELRLTLSDPDGVAGDAQRSLRAHTRAEPQPAAGGKTYHVYPVGYSGPRQEPAFTGLMAAYYMAAAHFDYQNAYPPRVQPGDTILVHAGTYLSDRHHYMNRAPSSGYLALATVFDGTYYLTAERHRRTADRDQGRGRRRGDLRRRRRGEPVQSDGRELPVLRRHHGAEHERRVPARASRTSPARRASR